MLAALVVLWLMLVALVVLAAEIALVTGKLARLPVFGVPCTCQILL